MLESQGLMWFGLLTLLCGVSVGRTCLQCDPRIRLLHEDLILSAPSVKDQIELTKIRDYAHLTYIQTSQSCGGIIDPTTLYRASTEYQSEFDRFLDTKQKGSLTFEAIQIMEKGRMILEKHLDIFIQLGLCPNKCGLLYQRVMDCSTCQYKMHTCPSPTFQEDCGEFPVQAEEGGQAVLDCFLPWHSLVQGRLEYHYSRARVPGTKEGPTYSQPIAMLEASDFTVLVVTKDSYVVLNQLHLDEEGMYRCSLQDQQGTVFSRVTFLLTVAAVPTQAQRPAVSLPTLPRAYLHSPFYPSKSMLLIIIAMVTALSLAASIGLIVLLGVKMKKRKDVEKKRRCRETTPQDHSVIEHCS